MSQFIPISQSSLFTDLLNKNILPNLVSSASIDNQRTTVQLVGAVARHCSNQIAPLLDNIIPGILKAAEKDDEELRESALQALEQLVLKCPAEIDAYLPTIVEIGNKFIKYDPVRHCQG